MAGLKVGIDFGTSNSGVAIYDGKKIFMLPIDRSNITPEVIKSVIYITRDYRQYIGQEAINTYYRDNVDRPRRFVRKRIGEIEYVASEMYYVRDVFMEIDELNPGRLIQYIKTGLRSEGYEGTRVFDKFFSLKEIIKLYLRNLKVRSESILNEEIHSITLGRPVRFFDDRSLDKSSEDILRQAGHEAGFKDVCLELEPIAAALFYETTLDKPQNALIFDFGGGTLDITILRLGDPKKRDVFATGGIGIAGSDFDRMIIQKRMLEHFGKGKFRDDPHIENLIEALADWQVIPQLGTPQVRTMLHSVMKKSKYPVRLKALETIIYNDLAFSFYNKVEAAKIELSSQGVSLVKIEEKDLNIWELLTRYQFERDIAEYHTRIEKCLLDTIIESGLEPEEIDVAIKTGGSSNIPYFTGMLESIFGPERVKASNTFSSVTAGLAIRAYEGDTRYRDSHTS
jgi:hypothetical chaperone protein